MQDSRRCDPGFLPRSPPALPSGVRIRMRPAPRARDNSVLEAPVLPPADRTVASALSPPGRRRGVALSHSPHSTSALIAFLLWPKSFSNRIGQSLEHALHSFLA